jgi:Protein of unknown function (DUF3489)
MTRLSDPHRVILSAAAQRDDGAVLPLPDTLKIKGGAVAKVLRSLKIKGLIDHQGTPRGDDPPPLRITHAGLEAIDIEPVDTGSDTAPAQADTGATAVDIGAQAVKVRTPVAQADGAATPATKGKAAKGKSKATTTKTAPAEKSAPRAGTKQALMIELLQRPEGATVEQIATVTGWQHHTVRGAISGALKKKLGLTVEARRSAPTSVVGGGSQARRTREVGPNKTGAKGSGTVYRIIESPREAN